MTEIQTNKKNNYKYFAAIVAGILVAYLILSSIVNSKIERFSDTLQLQISEQQALLASIAEITARNGADAVTESIVRDCQSDERVRFDGLLSRLSSGLSWAELNEVERLFGRCGNFSAQRKSVMVARLSRETEIYSKYVDQLKNLTSESHAEGYNVAEWNRLAEEESKQSELFNQLVSKQDQIISALLEGKNASSDEIVTILAEVSEIQESLLVANQQARELRSELISL